MALAAATPATVASGEEAQSRTRRAASSRIHARGVHGMVARASWVCDCAKATMIGQFVGCSLGCSDCHAWVDIQWELRRTLGAGTAPLAGCPSPSGQPAETRRPVEPCSRVIASHPPARERTSSIAARTVARLSV
jgi:hypothetical protein